MRQVLPKIVSEFLNIVHRCRTHGQAFCQERIMCVLFLIDGLWAYDIMVKYKAIVPTFRHPNNLGICMYITHKHEFQTSSKYGSSSVLRFSLVFIYTTRQYVSQGRPWFFFFGRAKNVLSLLM